MLAHIDPDKIVDYFSVQCFLFNVVLILLGQHYTVKNLVQCCQRGSRQHCTWKVLVNIVWTKSFYNHFYFGPVNFLIITGCWKYRAIIAQEKSRANIEQKDNIVRKASFLRFKWKRTSCERFRDTQKDGQTTQLKPHGIHKLIWLFYYLKRSSTRICNDSF